MSRWSKRAAFAHRQRRVRRVARVYAMNKGKPGFIGVAYDLRIDGVQVTNSLGALFMHRTGRRR